MFIEQSSVSHNTLEVDEFPLSDEEYGKVLDHVVVGCVDVAVVHGEEILLEKRNNDPIKDSWWIFGGRILVGETLQGTAQRQLKRELGLEVADAERFQQIGTFNLCWPTRRELPVTNGVHHLLIAHMVEVDDSERRSLSSRLLQAQQPMRWLNMDKPGELLLPEMQSIIDCVQERKARAAGANAVADSIS